MLKRIAIMSLAAAAVLSTAVASASLTPAAAQLSITFGSPPPPPLYEVVPAPRAGYVWAHYVLVNDRYVWTKGQWLAERPGYRYVSPTWERVYIDGREQWRHVPARWDRNGDGIPDRYQRHSERGPWGDRDHDGIPNAFDRYDNRYDYRR